MDAVDINDLADRLSDENFNAEDFVSRIVRDSIGHSDILAIKLKLQIFAEKTSRQLRESINRNYSKFLSMSNDVTLLEDEMDHLRSLSVNFYSKINLLRDYIGKNECLDEKSKKDNFDFCIQSRQFDLDSECVDRNQEYKEKSHLMACLSSLVDQAVAIGLIDHFDKDTNEITKESTGEWGTSKSDESSLITTDDGRVLIYQTHVSQINPETLIDMPNRQLFILDGCILLCSSALSANRYETPSYQSTPKKQRTMVRMRKLNLISAMTIDEKLMVTDIKDEPQRQSTASLYEMDNAFKLIRAGQDVMILRVSSNQTKINCINALLNCIENSRLTQNLSKLTDTSQSNDQTVIIALLWEQLDLLELQIKYREEEKAKEIILQCRQRLTDLSAISMTSSTKQIQNKLSQLTDCLIDQIFSEQNNLREMGRNGSGLRGSTHRQIDILLQLGYKAKAVDLFISNQQIIFPELKGRVSVIDDKLLFDPVNGVALSNFDRNYMIDALSTVRQQEKHELRMVIKKFYQSMWKTEQAYYTIFSKSQFMSAFVSYNNTIVLNFLLWLTERVKSFTDDLLTEEWNYAEEQAVGSRDSLLMTERISDFAQMTLEECHDEHFKIDYTFIVCKSLQDTVALAINEDKRTLINLVRCWNQADSNNNSGSGYSAFNPVTVMLRHSTSNQPLEDITKCVPLLYAGDKVIELISTCPEIVPELDKHLSVIDEKISGDLNDSLLSKAELSLSLYTLIFAKLFFLLSRQCLRMFVVELESNVVEAIIQSIKVYIHFLSQLIKHDTSNDSNSSQTEISRHLDQTEVEFVVENIRFIIHVVFRTVDNWFQNKVGHESKYFSKIYEKLDQFD